MRHATTRIVTALAAFSLFFSGPGQTGLHVCYMVWQEKGDVKGHTKGLPQVALAILPWQGGFLMQLRDNVPQIRGAWHWGLFGGHLDPGEDPHTAVLRELLEEIAYKAPSAELFGTFWDLDVVRHIFEVPLVIPPTELVLSEGRDMQILSLEQIRDGFAFSPVEGLVRPIVPGIRTALLEYFQRKGLS